MIFLLHLLTLFLVFCFGAGFMALFAYLVWFKHAHHLRHIHKVMDLNGGYTIYKNDPVKRDHG